MVLINKKTRLTMKLLKVSLIVLLTVILLPLVIVIVLFLSADMKEPELIIDPANYTLTDVNDTVFCEDSYLVQDKNTELWELYIKGSRQEKGAKQGVLTKDLMRFQEDVFIDKINEIIPSDSYLSFLRIMLMMFNRNLGEYVEEEYRDEIVAMSAFCTEEYNAIGNPYERQLNYHAAHDIGHTMQQYMLVGCSSFGSWGDNTQDGELIVGRNFDFYVGDDFAKNKLITFAVPDSGYKYASISWAGMVGVLSGMNEKGITVTINAAKGCMPTFSATPISIITREILQYASTTEEALDIAQRRKSFVNESILVGSKSENKCVSIEKTPEVTSLYESGVQDIITTNHYQSEAFVNDPTNVDNIAGSDSKYRYDRMRELLDEKGDIDYKSAIDILRNRYGVGGRDIGVSNEKTLNQSIAHHSVVFCPHDSMFWLSTRPWQSGEFVCYDLRGFFKDGSYPYTIDSLSVGEDEDFMKVDYTRLLEWRSMMDIINEAILEEKHLSDVHLLEDFATKNANHYLTWKLLGDYWATFGEDDRAVQFYNRAVGCEIPYKSDKEKLEQLIKELNDK